MQIVFYGKDFFISAIFKQNLKIPHFQRAYLSHFTPCFFQLFILENISLKIVHTFCRGGSMPSAHCDPSIEAEDPKLSESNSEQRE